MILRRSLLFILISFCFTNYNFAEDDSKVSDRIIDQNLNEKSSQLLMLHHLNSYSRINSKLGNELSNNDTEQELVNRKSPWLAFFLSLFLPTSGQIYNGDYTKAAIQGGLLLLGGGLVTTMACVECGDSNPAQSALLITGMGMAFSGYLWSIIDAPTSANNINDRIQNNSGVTVFNSNDSRFSLKLNRTPITKSYTISLAVKF